MYRKLQTRTDRRNISEKYLTIPLKEIYLQLYLHLKKKETSKDVHVHASNKEFKFKNTSVSDSFCAMYSLYSDQNNNHINEGKYFII